MEGHMFVEFQGRFSKVKENIICDVISYGQDQLFPLTDDVFINIEAIRKQGVCGDCMFEDDNEFTIRLNKSLSVSDLITTVLHELVHVKQYLNCMVMDTESSYEDRWQEIEAHALEKELAEGFNAQA
jgi:hypothetical protein|tara:strand:- start:2487 stop:2867 length:381 start_codon:yes stop_codon:yes gene_type:complete